MTSKGFTLMEILVYIAVLATVVLAVAAFLNWAIASYSKTKAIMEISDNARRAMEMMTYEIREAKSVYLPTSSTTQLSLETSHYLPPGESIGYIDFFLCGNDQSLICLKKDSQDPFAITTEKAEVSNLEFVYLATTTSVQISFDINFKNPNNRPEHRASLHLISTASLRLH